MDLAAKDFAPIVDGCQTVLRDHLVSMPNMVAGFVGPYFSRASKGRAHDPTNHYAEYVSLFLAEVASGRPSFLCDTDLPGEPEQIADAFTLAMPRWAEETKLKGVIERMAVSYCFAFGYGAVWMEEVPDPLKLRDDDDQLLWPIPRDIECDDAIWDTSTRAWDDGWFRGHRVVRPRFEIEREGTDAGWDMDAVGRMSQLGQDNRSRLKSKRDRDYKHRDFVAYRPLWLPKATLEDIEKAVDWRGWDEEYDLDDPNHHGWLVYLDDEGGKAEHVKKPEPYFGRRTGPYVLASGMPVPGASVGLSALVAVEGQARELNDYERAYNKSARDEKVVIAIDDDSGDVETAVKNAAHGGIVNVPMLNKDGSPNWALWDFTTRNQGMAVHLAELHASLTRALGHPDPSFGVVQGDATATEVSVAATAGQKRLGYGTGKFFDAVTEMGALAAHAMFTRDEFEMALPKGKSRFIVRTDEGEFAPAELPVLTGGDQGFAFEDLHIRFDYAQAAHKPPQVRQQEGMRLYEMGTALGQMLPQMAASGLRVDEFLEMLAEKFDEPGFNRLVDYKILGGAVKRLMMSEIAPIEADLRTARDAGQGGKTGVGGFKVGNGQASPMKAGGMSPQKTGSGPAKPAAGPAAGKPMQKPAMAGSGAGGYKGSNRGGGNR